MAEAAEIWPFEAARDYARNLNLQSRAEWYGWCDSGARPTYIPREPDKAYGKEFKLWRDWLGLKGLKPGPKPLRAATKPPWRSFEEAVAFARALGFKNQYEWARWAKTDARPHDIPSRPDNVYSNPNHEEWIGWRYWLGTNNEQRPSAAEQLGSLRAELDHEKLLRIKCEERCRLQYAQLLDLQMQRAQQDGIIHALQVSNAQLEKELDKVAGAGQPDDLGGAAPNDEKMEIAEDEIGEFSIESAPAAFKQTMVDLSS